MSNIRLSNNFIRNVVKLALNEDLYPSGDITSALIKSKKNISLKLISNQLGIIGGLNFANQTFKLIDKKIKFVTKKKKDLLLKRVMLLQLLKEMLKKF